ncbi:hypothetical protein BH09ACT7_BH09ACT7_60540 [soil metagenome]
MDDGEVGVVDLDAGGAAGHLLVGLEYSADSRGRSGVAEAQQPAVGAELRR